MSLISYKHAQLRQNCWWCWLLRCCLHPSRWQNIKMPAIDREAVYITMSECHILKFLHVIFTMVDFCNVESKMLPSTKFCHRCLLLSFSCHNWYNIMTLNFTQCLCFVFMTFADSLYLMLLSTWSARRHVAIMLPPSDASSENRSAAGRVSLSSHIELNEQTKDDSASIDAVVSTDSKQLVR